MAYNTASLTAYYIYPGGTATALTLETISTLGTYAAPTSAAHMRFKLVDDTNMPGIYEVQFHNDWFSVASARRGALVQMKGATGMAPVQFEFTLVGFDLTDADPGVDVVKISGDATAADNLEAATDGNTYNVGGGAIVAASVTGAVGSVTGAVGSVTGNVGGSVGSLATQAKADVNAEVVDALNVDTYAEPGQEAPAATASLVTKINYLYKAWRNKKTHDGSTRKLYADDGTTVDQKATDSDSGGTFTKGEIGSGP